jgi:hypothetical protein
VDHRDRDGSVKRDHRPRRDALEDLVDGKDLPPVGLPRAWRLVVDRGDRGLKVGTSRLARQRLLDQRDALGDLGAVPQRAVLLGQRDEAAVRAGARRTAGLVRSISASSPATSP